MIIRVPDLKPGMHVRTAIGSIVEITHVNVFDEKRSALVPAGRPQAYIPGCVFVRFKNKLGNEGYYTFTLEESVERVFVDE